MALVDEILGCPLLEITRSWWAVKLDTGVFRCQRSFVHNWRQGRTRHLDWYEDIVATGDSKHVRELWLFAPPNHVSPTGNTARMPLPEGMEGRGFQFNIGHADSQIIGQVKQRLQAQIIGRVENSDGDCICIAWDPVLGGMLTYETTLYDHALKGPAVNDDGTIFYPLKTNVYRFGWRVKQGKVVPGMWRPSLAPVGKLATDRLGVVL